MEKQEMKGTGADVSASDPRTILHEDVSLAFATPLLKAGIDYLPGDIEDQHAVGICTAISRVQLRQKQTGKKYSPDFQYLLQKKYIDQAWFEGSSVFAACKVANVYGFLPIELFTDQNGKAYVTEADRYLSYSAYIAKLQAIPLSEILRLLNLCVDKIAGYAQVNVSDPQAIAKAVNESPMQAGILCRYSCQKNWWTPSWAPKDIDPLRPGPETSGHAIILSLIDYTSDFIQKLANTWGIMWCLKGSAHINWSNYKMTEAWVDLITAPVIDTHPVTRKGQSGPVVVELQTLLNKKGAMPALKLDGQFGNKTFEAVKFFQEENHLVSDGVVGPKTWNKLLN